MLLNYFNSKNTLFELQYNEQVNGLKFYASQKETNYLVVNFITIVSVFILDSESYPTPLPLNLPMTFTVTLIHRCRLPNNPQINYKI